MERLSEAGRLAMIHQALVHRRHGIITALFEETEHPAARGLFVFNAMMIDFKALMIDPSRSKQLASDRASLAGSGAAFDRTSALWSAFGEAIERYSASAFFDDELHYASQNALGVAATPLEDFVLFSAEQTRQTGFEFAAPDADLVRAWVPALDLTEPERECWLPAQLVYLGMRVKQPGEIVFQSSSTGLACGMDAERAILSGLCETIERDAFAAMWQMRYAPRRLQVTDATLASLLPGVQHALQASPLQIDLWDISTDIGLPVVLCLARNRNGATMSVGASAHLSITQAINKAVIESLHGYIWADSILQSGTPLPERTAIDNPSDHFAYFLDRSRQSTLDFLFDNPQVIRSDDPALQQLSDQTALLGRLRQMGYRALAADVTAADIGSLGFQVVRTVVPGLQPLLFGDGRISLDTRRLQQIARHWGLPAVPPANTDPHPFP